MRGKYWTCSKFADWVRGTTYPLAAEWGEWDNIHEAAKAAHPVRFWLADTGIGFCQDVVCFIPEKISNARHYLRNRFIDRTHLMNTRLPPGNWYDSDTRLMHGMMETLVDYVEVECALMEDAKRRSRAAGLKRLEWEQSLTYEDFGKPDERSHQALAADEVLAIYLWWKDARPNRVDPYEDADIDLSDLGNMDREAMDKRIAIEDQYQDEDDRMLCRLVRVRHSMWT